jgi:hypothetical protein
MVLACGSWICVEALTMGGIERRCEPGLVSHAIGRGRLMSAHCDLHKFMNIL